MLATRLKFFTCAQELFFFICTNFLSPHFDRARLEIVLSNKFYLNHFLKEFSSSRCKGTFSACSEPKFFFPYFYYRHVEGFTVTLWRRTAILALFLCFLCVIVLSCTDYVSWIDTLYSLFFSQFIVSTNAFYWTYNLYWDFQTKGMRSLLSFSCWYCKFRN